jgi:hypothetical protein
LFPSQPTADPASSHVGLLTLTLTHCHAGCCCRVINGEADAATSQQLAELLQATAPELARPQAVRGIDARKLSQLLVCIARCGLLDTPLYVLDPLVRELLRGGGQKLPRDTPDLLAELALALAQLGWEEEEVWTGITSAATALLSGSVIRTGWSSSATSAAALLVPPLPPPAAGGWVSGGGAEQQANPFADETAGGFEGFIPGVLPSVAPLGELYKGTGRGNTGKAASGQAAAAAAAAAAGGPDSLAVTAARSNSSSSGSSMAPRRFLAQDLACLAQALAAAGVEDAVLLSLLAQEAARKAPIFKLEQLTAVLQAYCRLGWPHAGLQAAVGARLQQLLPRAAVDEALSCGAALAGLQPVPWQLMLALGQLVLDAPGRVLGKQQALELLAIMASACQQPPDAITAGRGDAAGLGTTRRATAAPGSSSSSSRSSSSKHRKKRAEGSRQAVGIDALGSSSSSSSSSSRLPASLLRVVLAAVAGTPLSVWTGAEAEQAARSLAALQLQPPGAAAAAVEAVAAAAVAHAASSNPEQLVGVLWGVSACGCRDSLLLQVVVEALMPGAAGAAVPTLPAGPTAESDSRRTSRSSSGSSSSSQGAPSLDDLLADLPDMPQVVGQQVGAGPWSVAAGRGRRAPAVKQPAAGDSNGGVAAPADALPTSQLLVVPGGGLATRRAAGKRRSALQQLGVQGVAELLWALQQHGREDLAAFLMEEQAKPRRKRRP